MLTKSLAGVAGPVTGKLRLPRRDPACHEASFFRRSHEGVGFN